MKLIQKLSLITTLVLGINLLMPAFVMAQTASYGFSFKFGTPGTGNGQFQGGIGGIATDISGNVYVTDGNNRVQKFDSSGTYISQFGSAGTDDGEFDLPVGIALDTAGNIYVADYSNNRIEKFDSAGTYVSQFGSGGTGDGEFLSPFFIAFDTSGNIYVTENVGNRVQKFDSSGAYISQFGTTGTGDGQFNSPSGIAVDTSGNIYVVDAGNNRIQKFDSTGTYVSKFGSLGTGNGQFNNPVGITLDTSGNIYVTDYNNNRVQKFDSSGTYLTQFGSIGSNDGQFSQTYGIALGRSGRVLVGDVGNNRIQVFAPVVTITSIGQGEETIQPGILQLTSVPANFNFPPVTITNIQTYTTLYLNGQTVPEKLTAEDRRFSGGFEVQMTATDYVGQNNAANVIPVSNLGVATQTQSVPTDFQQTTTLQNIYTNGEGALIAGSQGAHVIVSQTLPFYFPMFGRESNQLVICSNGFMVTGANVAGLQPSDFAGICASPNSTPPSGNYGIIVPYIHTTGSMMTTQNTPPFDTDNGIYYNQVSDNEVHIRFKMNINSTGADAGSIELTVALFKDGRIEFHYGPNTDPNPPEVLLRDTETTVAVSPEIEPFTSYDAGSDYNGSQIRFSPISAFFNDVSKPGTPPIYAPTNVNAADNEQNFMMFTEDSGNPGFSVPVTTMEGGACSYHGRLGNYTLYPSFLLQIPPTTPADTYQNTITFTIIDKTYPNGVNFCPPI